MIEQTSSATTLVASLPAESSMDNGSHTVVVIPPSEHSDTGEKEEEDEQETKKEPYDIEHLPVVNDPRLWSNTLKSCILFTIAFSSMAGTISTSIFFPVLPSLELDLNTNAQMISIAISLFILLQGVTPMIWSTFSEIKGRRAPYISSLVMYVAATVGCARATSVQTFIALRCLQAVGSSAVLALGAGTLSDIYDVHERGTKLGIYYISPALGPAVGPIFGGLLSSGSGNWRNAFWFLLAYGILSLGGLIWLPETFRKERSLAWRSAMSHARNHERAHDLKEQLRSSTAEPITLSSELPRSQMEATLHPPAVPSHVSRVFSTFSVKAGQSASHIRLQDVNPFPVLGSILTYSTVAATAVSGILFSCQYAIAYTAVTTYSSAPYNFESINIGLVLLSFGLGNILGSVGGGRYSDYILARLKAANGGVSEPEMRIRSTRMAMIILPPLLTLYAWLVERGVMIAGPVTVLFFLGMTTIWIYSSTLAYIVDSNPGKSSTAVAVNSFARGVGAAVASQVCTPLINGMGHGWFYTGLSVVIALVCLSLVAVPWANDRRVRRSRVGLGSVGANLKPRDII